MSLNSPNGGKLARAAEKYIHQRDQDMLFSIATSPEFSPEVRTLAKNKLARELGIQP